MATLASTQASGIARLRFPRPVDSALTPRDDLARVHASDHLSQAMGRDDGIVLVSDWVESP
jgi:hypothetical protein